MSTIFAKRSGSGNGNERGQLNQSRAMFARRELAETLIGSKIYQEYQRAFTEATGVVVSLRGVDWRQPSDRCKQCGNQFCALMARRGVARAVCQWTEEKFSPFAWHQPQTLTCFCGMGETAVPVRSGEMLSGFLQAGPMFRQKPTEAQFFRVLNQLRSWDLQVDGRERSAYFGTRVLTPKQYKATIILLGIFAQHLSLVSNQLLVRQQNAQLPMIARAKDYIDKKQAEALSLGSVAKVVNVSPFHFCKTFKKATGLNFTGYVSWVRIEKAKNLLPNPNLRVSEIAFAVGF